MIKPNVMLTSDWHEDMGNCVFFHFDTSSEPPSMLCGTPLDNVFDEMYWTHFIEVEFNPIFDQAMALNAELK